MNVGAAPLAELLAQRESDNTTPVNLQALGAALYQCLFAGEIGMLFNRALGETIGNEALGLRLRLRINPPELAALPWKFLYSPERRLFLAASVETPLSRYLNLPEPVRKLACPEKINLLVIITQNSGLDTTAERQALEKVASQLRDRLTVDFLEGEATGAAIRTALRQKDYHILHYAGHGAFKFHEQQFKFSEAFAIDQQRVQLESGNTSARADFAEKHFTTAALSNVNNALPRFWRIPKSSLLQKPRCAPFKLPTRWRSARPNKFQPNWRPCMSPSPPNPIRSK